MVRAPMMHCDRLHDPGNGNRPLALAERLGRWRLSGLLLGAWLVGGIGGTGGCAKDPEVKAVLLTKEVDAALAEQKWELAEKKSQEIVNLAKLSDVSRDQAKLKLEQSRSEQQARLQYQKFIGYLNSEADTAVGAYRDMPESSYYRQQAKAEYEKIRPVYIEDHLNRAQSALVGARCDDVKVQLQLVLDVDPQNAKAMDLGKKPCPKKP